MAQYGNQGYSQVGYGTNPYDQRDAGPADAGYDDRTYFTGFAYMAIL